MKERRRFWSAGDLAALRKIYPRMRTDEVARRLRRTVASTYGMAGKLELRKSPAFLLTAESGRLQKGQTQPGTEATQFPKGHVPANKGLRRPGWGPGRMKETQFRKGQRCGMAAKNWVPVGTMRPDSEGYLRIKVREAVAGKEPTGFGNTQAWPLYSRYLWERHHGPIPPKHLVGFKDRNRAHCVIENLELITMAENARRNVMWNRYPREVAEAIQLRGVLMRRIRSLSGKE